MKILNDWRSPFVVALLTFVSLALSANPSCSAEHKDRLLRVPVFFITDRNLQPSKHGEIDFGARRKYIEDCKHDPFMGSAYCVVANVDGKQSMAKGTNQPAY
jgi:hypothetical protein